MAAAPIRCPECDEAFRPAQPIASGKHLRCPNCDAVFRPDEADEPRPVAPGRIVCPECGVSIRLTRPVVEGQRIRCGNCRSIVAVDEQAQTEEAREEPPPAPASRARRSRPHEEDTEERPPRRVSSDPEEDEPGEDDLPPRSSDEQKKQKKGGLMPLLLIGGGVGLLLLLCCGGLGLFAVVGGKRSRLSASREAVQAPTAIVKVGPRGIDPTAELLSGPDPLRVVVFRRPPNVLRKDPYQVDLFDLRTGQQLGKTEIPIAEFDQGLPELALSPEGDRLAALAGRTRQEEQWDHKFLSVYSLPDGKPLIERWAVDRGFRFMHFLGRDRLLAVDQAGAVKVLDLKTRTATAMVTLEKAKPMKASGASSPGGVIAT
jgi:hypothetical protein